MLDVALESPDDQWTHTDENLAMLVDRLSYWLDTEYVGWVTDPDDPDVKRRREERKRSGVKPPPVPILPVVARRPPAAEARAREQAEALKKHFEDPPLPGGSKIAALDSLLGG